MNRFLNMSLVVVLALTAGAWSRTGQAQQVHDAVAKARGEFGLVPVGHRPAVRYRTSNVQPQAIAAAPVKTPQLPVASPAAAVAQAPATYAPVTQAQAPRSQRSYSYAPAQTTNPSAFFWNSAPSRQPGFQDAGAKIRGQFAY
jgi:hypothetical protein